MTTNKTIIVRSHGVTAELDLATMWVRIGDERGHLATGRWIEGHIVESPVDLTSPNGTNDDAYEELDAMLSHALTTNVDFAEYFRLRRGPRAEGDHAMQCTRNKNGTPLLCPRHSIAAARASAVATAAYEAELDAHGTIHGRARAQRLQAVGYGAWSAESESCLDGRRGPCGEIDAKELEIDTD